MKTNALIDTLLKDPDPSIRWKARVHVVGESPTSRPIRALREEIRTSPTVHALLSLRDRLARSATPGSVYHHWQGLHWMMASLADIGYPEGDRTLFPVRDRVLEVWLGPQFFKEFDANTKAQSYAKRGVPLMRGRYRRCGSQQGNALLSVLALGLADERADKLAERLLHWQWPDGGWNCDRDPAADTSSFMETLLPMRGLAAYARATRKAAPARAAKRATEVFLHRKLFRRASNGAVIAAAFVELHYPLYWHYDVLAGLKAMADLGRIRDARCADALDLLESKRLADGGWPAEKRYHKGASRTLKAYADYVDWGGTSAKRMNPWITVDALAVLRQAGRVRV